MKTSLKNNKVILEFEIGEYNENLIDFLELLEISNKSCATEKDIKAISEEIKENWWEKNKNRFLK
jgi:hypothetical protein